MKFFYLMYSCDTVLPQVFCPLIWSLQYLVCTLMCVKVTNSAVGGGCITCKVHSNTVEQSSTQLVGARLSASLIYQLYNIQLTCSPTDSLASTPYWSMIHCAVLLHSACRCRCFAGALLHQSTLILTSISSCWTTHRYPAFHLDTSS